MAQNEASQGKVNGGRCAGREGGVLVTVGRIGPLPPLSTGAGGGALPEAGAQSYARVLFFCVAAITVARLIGLMLSRTELFFDEAQYWFWSRDLAFGYYSKPPMIAWIIRGATSICGMSEACIRAPSPLIHAVTALAIYGIGRRLYDARTGFWAGIVYVTLPGVSFSSALISTDVPLLFFVALALLAIVNMREGPSWAWAAVLGVAIGCGLLSKYAMSYVLLGLALYGIFTPQGRALFRTPHLYTALALGAAIIAPNIIWNAANRFATFAHTADNASWEGGLFHPAAALNFVAGQLGVFGPLLFAAFAYFAFQAFRNRDADPRARMLLLFSVPVLVLMILQAFISRAHANWAAFAYVGGTVFVTAALLRAEWLRLFRVSLGLHLAAAVLAVVAGAFAGRMALPVIGDPFARVMGWKFIAKEVGERAENGGFRAIATDWRPLAATFAYYLRDRNIPIVALRRGPPRDHFELTRPLGGDTPRPILLVSYGGFNLRSAAGREAAVAEGCPEGAYCGEPLRNASRLGAIELAQGKKRRRFILYAIRWSAE